MEQNTLNATYKLLLINISKIYHQDLVDKKRKLNCVYSILDISFIFVP